MRFPSTGEALQAAQQWMTRVEQAAVEVFAVPDLPGAQGVRFLGYEWLWLQPPSVGPYIDEVSLVFGDTYLAVTIGGTATGTTPDTAIQQARTVADLATT